LGRLFGTDGVRGLANADLTPELALALAVSAAREVASHSGDSRPMAVVGRDTRPSGELLESAVVAGLLSAGCDVEVLGVTPTPAVSYAVASGARDLGVVVSASHNPMPDNGVKLFGRGGYKLPDDVEDRIAARLRDEWSRPVGRGVGRRYDDMGDVRREEYVAHHVATAVPLGGLRVVLDCANGAGSVVAPEALRRAGADVTVLNDDLSGYRINDGCGATAMDGLRASVVAAGADVGIALDGDADRCLAVSADGDVVDGDQLLAILAVDAGAPAVVATVMANLGFTRAMASHGIEVVETAVGDRYVLAAMRSRGIALGGEQSGHLVMADHMPTGDGLLTALQVLSVMARTGRTLADLAAVMTRLPQVLLNVRVADKAAALAAAAGAVAEAEAELGDRGRVLVRPSGTEPLVRVMVEAVSEDVARRVAQAVERAILPG
jgi:phosphoglucosamine mutase